MASTIKKTLFTFALLSTMAFTHAENGNQMERGEAIAETNLLAKGECRSNLKPGWHLITICAKSGLSKERRFPAPAKLRPYGVVKAEKTPMMRLPRPTLQGRSTNVTT